MIRFVGAGARGGAPEVRDTAFTWPNLITLVRLLALPVFVWIMFGPEDYLLAFIVLGLIGLTDWFDGYVARRFNQVSRLGAMVDPIADRLLLVVVLVSFLVAGIVPWWIFVIIIVPDVILSFCAVAFFHMHPGLEVTFIGKVRTALLMIGTAIMLAGRAHVFTQTPMWLVGFVISLAGCAGHLVAFVQYSTGMLRAAKTRS
ncbi:CDP-alcohol phosphatidyltransferase family protein [Spelaeicoccus albus]|uniref:Cardiolipin synthase n=1 Tax=Spelaeicoccus albus TaxID=1280376 RepID=A0A7Z0D521_9MICO|nr:CDP-alcohol phosphatidyltransferase family protein [Spelaeicoccus albus]NYI68949.1 cardiolipin synthase [Spelaeicoccus albus]